MSYISQLRANIVAAITRKNLTQAAVAERMNIPANALSSRLHGHIPFRLPELLLLAALLESSLDQLLDGVEEEYREMHFGQGSDE
jgi:transcriptional regulator with XRE-family HTH domain